MPNTPQWRRFGWQHIEFEAPADWYLSKISTDRATGELELTDKNQLPRLQLKWHDARNSKSVNPAGTLTELLKGVQRSA